MTISRISWPALSSPTAFRISCKAFAATNSRSPFASPPGVGESSAIVNVLWGWFNFAVAGALLRYFFPPLPPPLGGSIATALGVLVAALWLAYHFGKVRNSAPHP